MAGDEPLSPQWPDVYKMIDDTRTVLSDQIAAIADRFDRLIVPNENRLTMIEATQAAHEKRMDHSDTRIDGVVADVEAIKTRQDKEEAATDALAQAERLKASNRIATLSWRHWLIGTLVGIVVGVPPLVDMFLKIF